MKTINEMKTTYAVLFTVIIVFLLGCLGKLKQTNDRIDELKEPVVVATVNIDDKMLMHIAQMEKDLDMMKAKVEDLEYHLNAVTNCNTKQAAQ